MIFSENILICMALPLLLTVFFVRDSARQLVINFIIGMAVCLLGAYVSGFIDVAFGYGTEDTAIFISPVVEETMKFLPLLFYFLMFAPEDDRLFSAAVGVGARKSATKSDIVKSISWPTALMTGILQL